MRVTTTVPRPHAPENLRQIADHIAVGHTAGHVDITTNSYTARACYDPKER